MKKRLLIVGGVGGGEIASAVFADMNIVKDEWQIEGYLNDVVNPGGYFGKYKVLGGSNEIMDYVNKGYYIHYALHFNAKYKHDRVEAFRKLKIPIEAHASAIHPSAYIMEGTKIGYGVLIAPNVITSFGAMIGNFVHCYSGCFIGHDSRIHDFSTITARSVVGARINIKEGAHIGLNSVIREDLTVGKYAIVGMGAVLTKSVKDYDIVVGNPAKPIGSAKKYIGEGLTFNKRI